MRDRKRGFSRQFWFLLVGSALAAQVLAAVPPTASTQTPGQKLAEQLRSLRPVAGKGVMHLRAPDGTWYRNIPVQLGYVSGDDVWESVFRAFGTNGVPVDTLYITHTAGQPNRYVYLHGTNTDNPTDLSRSAIYQPFAGSDFSLADLGLEFLWWPHQRILREAIRKGRHCVVLQSLNPHPGIGSYARVISWIDQKTEGLLGAEAYNLSGQMVKQFSIGSLKRVKGPDGRKHWELKSMEMRNAITDARTRIVFDLHSD